jgi:hypothetical protein
VGTEETLTAAAEAAPARNSRRLTLVVPNCCAQQLQKLDRRRLESTVTSLFPALTGQSDTIAPVATGRQVRPGWRKGGRLEVEGDHRRQGDVKSRRQAAKLRCLVPTRCVFLDVAIEAVLRFSGTLMTKSHPPERLLLMATFALLAIALLWNFAVN